jgi:hypothetical protein
MARFKWELLNDAAPPRILHDVPNGSIKTTSGTELPAHVLTVWDDASLLAVGIRRTVVDDEG